MHENRPQRFGTQYLGLAGNPVRLWPVIDPVGVNDRRARLDLEAVPEADLATMWTSGDLDVHRRRLAREFDCPPPP